MNKYFLAILITSLTAAKCAASGVEYSVSGGWPFVVTPSISFIHEDIEYYANYKIGLDDGFSLGFEKPFNQHVFGAFIGAVGARNARYECGERFACNLTRIAITDKKTTQGIGLSYEYRFANSRNGWAMRLEAGYGKESTNDVKRIDGNLQIVYHF